MSEYLYSERQTKVLHRLRTTSASLSIVGSLSLLLVILLKTKSSIRKSSYHRLLCALSVMDILTSLCMALGNVPAPEYLEAFIPTMEGARGNDTTCRSQAFLLLYGRSSTQFYTTALMVYFSLTICTGTTDEKFSKRWEPCLHAFCIIVPLVFAVVGLQLGLFNWTGDSYCGTSSWPPACESTEWECIRGGTSLFPYLWSTSLAPDFLNLSFCAFSIFRVYRHVHRISLRAARSALTSNAARMEKQVAIQCMLYAVTFINMYAWPLPFQVAAVTGNYDVIREKFYPLLVLTNLFYWLQGLFNFLLFLRLRYVRVRGINSEETKGRSRALYYALMGHEGVLARLESEARSRRVRSSLSSGRVTMDEGENSVAPLQAEKKSPNTKTPGAVGSAIRTANKAEDKFNDEENNSTAFVLKH